MDKISIKVRVNRKVKSISITKSNLFKYKPANKGKKYKGYYTKRTKEEISNIREKQIREKKLIKKFKVSKEKPIKVKLVCGFNYSSSKFDGYEHSKVLDIYLDNDIIEDLDHEKLYEYLWSIRMGLNKYHKCIRRLHFITFTYIISVNGIEETRYMSTHIASFYELKEEMIKTILYIIASVRSESYDIKWLRITKMTAISVSYKNQYQSYTGK